MSEPFNTVT